MSAAANAATPRVHARPRREVPSEEPKFRSSDLLDETERLVSEALETKAADESIILQIS
jgi:hypothetical protein